MVRRGGTTPKRYLQFVAGLLALLVLPVSLSAATVTAVADRSRLHEGESLLLEVQVEGKPQQQWDSSVLDQDWELLNHSQSSQVRMINGDFSQSVTHSLSLLPRRTGLLIIPPLCFGADCSAQLEIQVEQGQKQAGREQRLLLEVETDASKIVAGSQLVLTVRVLFRKEVKPASLSEPEPEGVEAETRRFSKDQSGAVDRDGYRYQTVERRYAIFPAEPGTLVIPPLRLSAEVSTRNFPFGTGRRLYRRSEALQITVLPRPDDLGDRPWIPAKDMTLVDDWQKNLPDLQVGEPVTRTLTLNVAGLSATRLPDLHLQVPESWKMYADQPGRRDGDNDAGIVGTLVQKAVLVPTRAGRFTLPAMALEWYDTGAGTWQTAQVEALTVEVAPDETAAGNAAPLPAEPGSSEETAPRRPPGQAAGFWPWVSLGLGLGWLVTLCCWWGRRFWPRPGQPAVTPAKAAANQEKQARHRLLKAAGSNDPVQTRQALEYWYRCLSSGGNPALPEEAEERLHLAVNELNRVLYGPEPGSWQGDELAAAVRSLKKVKNTEAPAGLPPLYPGNCGEQKKKQGHLSLGKR
ncbi:MAG: hypothetical protein CSA21_00390 [Deltaproteobacteria bacterium]|nr:MAG: hypothetical protein CSA21_00390 [Deltaproteobacteria bacterium]